MCCFTSLMGRDSMNAPTAVTSEVPQQPVRERFDAEFSGSGAEYFRIWIVNIALTLLTLGIYSAWAKVRNKQYFYGNTRLAGDSFEYTASPISILKGRLIVFGIFIAYHLTAAFQPVLAVVLALLIVPLMPWIVIKAVAFNLRYSSYRGLRFHFDGRYWEAFRVYLLWTLATIVSLGLAYPYVAWRRKQFLVQRARYGCSPFAFTGEASWFYVVYVVGGIIYAGVIIAAGLLVGGASVLLGMIAGTDMQSLDLEGAEKAIAIGVGLVLYALMLLSFLVFNSAIQALIANHVWQHTSIGKVGFDLRLNVWRVIWIQSTSIVAIIASLGLLIPWAKVRMARYRLSCFAMVAAPAVLECFVASEHERVAATGAEMGDALDLDLGL
jgi:uncharacterized membrane protein YjgN (DUF898 family)